MSNIKIFPTDCDHEQRFRNASKKLDLAIRRHVFFHRDSDPVRRVADHFVENMISRIHHAEDVPRAFQKEAHLYLDLDVGLILGPNTLLTAERADLPILSDPLERIAFGTAILEAVQNRIPPDSIPDTNYTFFVDQQLAANILEIALGRTAVRLALVYRAYK